MLRIWSDCGVLGLSLVQKLTKIGNQILKRYLLDVLGLEGGNSHFSQYSDLQKYFPEDFIHPN